MLSDLILIMYGDLQLHNKSLKVALIVHRAVHAVELAGVHWAIFKFQVCFNNRVSICMCGMCMKDP